MLFLFTSNGIANIMYSFEISCCYDGQKVKKRIHCPFFKQQIILIGVALTMMIVGTGLWGKAKDSVRGDNLCSFEE